MNNLSERRAALFAALAFQDQVASWRAARPELVDIEIGAYVARVNELVAAWRNAEGREAARLLVLIEDEVASLERILSESAPHEAPLLIESLHAQIANALKAGGGADVRAVLTRLADRRRRMGYVSGLLSARSKSRKSSGIERLVAWFHDELRAPLADIARLVGDAVTLPKPLGRPPGAKGSSEAWYEGEADRAFELYVTHRATIECLAAIVFWACGTNAPPAPNGRRLRHWVVRFVVDQATQDKRLRVTPDRARRHINALLASKLRQKARGEKLA